MGSSAGRTKSISRTPQAHDDFGALWQGERLVLDVMANDLGGNAKTLYSVHQSNLLNPLSSFTLPSGATVTIVDGRIAYDANGRFDSLAEGEKAIDTFTYAIRLADGTISTATATITITGRNDVAKISGDVSGSVCEDGTLTARGTLRVDDADAGEGLFQTLSSEELDTYFGTFTFDAENGAWSYALDNAAAQALAAGETRSETLTVRSKDGTAWENVTVTIHGANDAPEGLVGGDTGAIIVENGAAGEQVADLAGTDIDGDTLVYYLKDANGQETQTDGNFVIDRMTGVVTTARGFDHELDGGSLAFTAYASDGHAEASGTYAVTVADAQETPPLIGTPFTAAITAQGKPLVFPTSFPITSMTGLVGDGLEIDGLWSGVFAVDVENVTATGGEIVITFKSDHSFIGDFGIFLSMSPEVARLSGAELISETVASKDFAADALSFGESYLHLFFAPSVWPRETAEFRAGEQIRIGFDLI